MQTGRRKTSLNKGVASPYFWFSVEEDSTTAGSGKIIVFIRENENTIMKKLLYLAVMGFIFSCSDNKSDAAIESAPVTPGIENTNGNIPDSSNTIPLNSTLPVDSSRLNDSVPR